MNLSLDIIISGIVLLIFYLIDKLIFWRKQGLPNCLLHNIKAIFEILFLHDLNCMKNNGKVVGTYELFKPMLMITDRKLINEVLIEKTQLFSDHRVWALPDYPMGKSLYMQSFESGVKSRDILTHALTTVNLNKNRQIFQYCSKLFLTNIDKHTKLGQQFDIKPYFEAYVFDCILKSFFDTQIDSINERENDIIVNHNKLITNQIPIAKLFALFSPNFADILNIRYFDNESMEFFLQICANVLRHRKEPKQDLLQMIIDSEKLSKRGRKSSKIKISNREIVDNCLYILIDGYHKTTAAIINLCYHLAKNPLKQEKLIEELDVVYDGSELDVDKMRPMKYLKACIDESQRLMPSMMRIERKTRTDCKLDNIFIPKDTYIVIPTYAVHRDPEYFENPDEFRPERFLQENKHLIQSGTYLPFSDGSRSCVGMKFSIGLMYIFAEILHKYRIVESNQTEPIKYFKRQLISMPKNLNIKLENRV